ncbi:MAG TPA: hydantoinase/oxoprolinase family protein [Gemmatimonadales bacterium]|nr:hydantoinase/oxoprolinase family protein [Gemmatimonadales bacterium]
MNAEPVIGWDLGGAHLKAARLGGSGAVERVLQIPCPLWQGMHHLDAALERAAAELGRASVHAVTMTGEMVDLFGDRREGVARLVTAMREHVSTAALWLYAGADGFLEADRAGTAAGRIASANWMASASLVAARVPAALLVDIGSTTTDLVLVEGGCVRARGRDDGERLAAGELLYTGVVRTPVMALVPHVPFGGEWVPLMAECFATTADVHRLGGRLPDGADQHPAADGGEKTIPGSARRLARMIGRDLDSAPPGAWRALADWLARAQTRAIGDAADRLLSRGLLADDAPMVGAGIGRFVAAELARGRDRPYLDFGSLVSGSDPERVRASDCAPAVAVAWLAQRARPGQRPV